MLTQATKLAIDLKNDVENRYLLNALRRRIAQTTSSLDTSDVTIESRNSCTFTWEAAHCNLVNMENPTIKMRSHLSISQLLETGSLLEENVSYSVLDVLRMFNIPLGFRNAVCQQLITCFPVWCIHFSEVDILVNVCEVLLTPGLLEDLLRLHNPEQPPTCKRSRKKRTTTKNTSAVTKSSRPGRPSIAEKFPTIVETASEFIKAHGYAAHVRRREGVASTPGVSLSNIRQHLLDEVPA